MGDFGKAANAFDTKKEVESKGKEKDFFSEKKFKKDDKKDDRKDKADAKRELVKDEKKSEKKEAKKEEKKDGNKEEKKDEKKDEEKEEKKGKKKRPLDAALDTADVPVDDAADEADPPPAKKGKAESKFTKKSFLESAATLKMTFEPPVGDAFSLEAKPWVFEKESVGWSFCNKIGFPINKACSQYVTTQASINFTAHGSQQWKSNGHKWNKEEHKHKAVPAPDASKIIKNSSREAFMASAPSIPVTVDGTTHTLKPKVFATGACGWMLNGKTKVKVGADSVNVQMNINCTALNSKNWSKADSEVEE
eukprot:Selendium_serpulae@DN4456_c0_g1_i1.p1